MYVYVFINTHICSAEHLAGWNQSVQQSQKEAFVVDFLIVIAYRTWTVTVEWSCSS